MPGLGKSGTSRMSCFKCSQLMSILTAGRTDGWAGFGITTLLRCEMFSGPRSGWIPTLEPRPLALLLVLRGAENAILTADRACPWPALRRFRRDYCAPNPRFRACVPHVPQTIGSRHPAHARER